MHGEIEVCSATLHFRAGFLPESVNSDPKEGSNKSLQMNIYSKEKQPVPYAGTIFKLPHSLWLPPTPSSNFQSTFFYALPIFRLWSPWPGGVGLMFPIAKATYTFHVFQRSASKFFLFLFLNNQWEFQFFLFFFLLLREKKRNRNSETHLLTR